MCMLTWQHDELALASENCVDESDAGVCYTELVRLLAMQSVDHQVSDCLMP